MQAYVHNYIIHGDISWAVIVPLVSLRRQERLERLERVETLETPNSSCWNDACAAQNCRGAPCGRHGWGGELCESL